MKYIISAALDGCSITTAAAPSGNTARVIAMSIHISTYGNVFPVLAR